MNSRSFRTLYVCLVAFGIFLPCRVAEAATVTLAWDANQEPVAGYRLYVRPQPGTYTQSIDVGPSNTFTFPDAVPGQQYCFVVTAYAEPSLESRPSNEVCTSAPSVPTSAPPTSLPPTSSLPTDGYFELVSLNSGKCLDVSGGSTAAGAPAIQWTCHGGANQHWRLEPAGGGGFRIISRASGQALDVSGGSVDDNAPTIQWLVHGGDNQVWTPQPASNGYVYLIGRQSGKALDIQFGSADDGATVVQYTPHGGANQQWFLRAVN